MHADSAGAREAMSRRRLPIPEWLQRRSRSGAFHGRRVAVVGLGQFGGGLGATRFFAERGAEVLIVDRADAETLSDSLERLPADGKISLALECDAPERVAEAFRPDIACVTPAIRPDAPWLRALRAIVPCVTTEVALFLALCRGKVVGVTGSNGKSTTAALTAWLLAGGMNALLIAPEHVEFAAPASTPSGVSPSNVLEPAGLRADTRSVSVAPRRRCFLGGNIGGSLLPWAEDIGPEDVVVLELSSFQLMWLRRLHPRVHVAVVTGFAPNHLNWHRTLDEYRRAKQLLLAFQTPHDWSVLAAAPKATDRPAMRHGDPAHWPVRGGRIVVEAFGRVEIQPAPDRQPRAAGGAVFVNDSAARMPAEHSSNGRTASTWMTEGRPVGQAVPKEPSAWTRVRELSDLVAVAAGCVGVPGEHNRCNAALAAATAWALGIVPAEIGDTVATFPGLSHRLETIAYIGSVPAIDDSASTTIDSTLAALQALGDGCVLICGGASKGAEPGPLVAAFERCRAVATIGPAGRLLQELWAVEHRGRSHESARSGRPGEPEVAYCETLERATSWALRRATGSRAVLFSPGFASYHAFRNYADRGRAFRRLVEAWLVR